MIGSLFFPFLVSAITTVALIGGLFKRASAWGLVDHPDTHRKTHLVPTPLIGGLAIFICVTMFQLLDIPTTRSSFHTESLEKLKIRLMKNQY